MYVAKPSLAILRTSVLKFSDTTKRTCLHAHIRQKFEGETFAVFMIFTQLRMFYVE